MISESALNALENDLESLTARLKQFNIFEAVGQVRNELTHSDFLAYLFNPSQNHGLDAAFTRLFLQKVLFPYTSSSVAFTPDQLARFTLDPIVVRREWQNIDILLESKTHKLVVVIENKIDSFEHSGQLQRYREIVQRNYGDWQALYLFLTPGSAPPSDKAYLPCSYTLVAEAIEEIITLPGQEPAVDVKTLLIHYAQMLRRHIVTNRDIARLCQDLYHKHKEALDLIYQYRPSFTPSIRQYLESLIQNNPDTILDESDNRYIRFASRSWEVPALLTASNWTSSNRILLMEFLNNPGKLNLSIFIGPGNEQVRNKLLNMAKTHPEIFKSKSINNIRWYEIYSRPFLRPENYSFATEESLQTEINRQWNQFLEVDFPLIEEILKSEEWIWNPSFTQFNHPE